MAEWGLTGAVRSEGSRIGWPHDAFQQGDVLAVQRHLDDTL
jgi:hypothetical protein